MSRILSKVFGCSRAFAASSKWKRGACFDPSITWNHRGGGRAGARARDELASVLFASQPIRKSFCSKAIPCPPISFTVTRCEPELVSPAKPTPRESKWLSDIDDGLRYQIPIVQFYSKEALMKGSDPVKVVREALAKALMYYYPFAGRLKEGDVGKLKVDCTGEGVMFIEADADVTLDRFAGDDGVIDSPIPCFNELLYNVPGAGGIVNCHLLLIQVTRLKCGGFIFAIRLNHTMADGVGLLQFMTAVGEMARGASAPSVLPVWERELLDARDPPQVMALYQDKGDEVPDMISTITQHISNDLDMSHRTFFFGPAEISTLHRKFVLGASSTRMDTLIACVEMPYCSSPTSSPYQGGSLATRGQHTHQVQPFITVWILRQCSVFCSDPGNYRRAD